MLRILALLATLFVGASMAHAQTTAQPLDPENTLVLTLKDGKVNIRLRPDLAPKHVAQVKTLVRRGSDLPNIPAEFSPQPFQRGTLGMARSSSPDSANSQFFICFDQANHLTGQYTAFGQVVSGMEFIDKIKKGDGPNGQVRGPDKIVSLRVLADVK